MKFSSTTLLAVLSSLTATVSAGCSFEGGNYYCSETKKLSTKVSGFLVVIWTLPIWMKTLVNVLNNYIPSVVTCLH